jgi:catechol 2,3-dioxygenase-like lactoylglutathione lyase family enzyme
MPRPAPCNVLGAEPKPRPASSRGVNSLLSDAPAYATLPASDIERAKRFYREQLGLKPAQETEVGLFFDCGGQRFAVFDSGGAASGTHTQLTWQVVDIETEVEDLQANGVVFERYDQPPLKTHAGVATTGRVKGAWFKDSEGNLLSLVELPAAR